MSEWISVKERMPNRGEEVLVLGHSGDMSVRYIPKSKGGEYTGDDGKSWYPGGRGVDWTSHWMKLPELPKP